MSTAFQALHAAGTRGQCRPGKVRHTITIDESLFQAIQIAAVAHNRSISEEIVSRLKVREVPLANPGP